MIKDGGVQSLSMYPQKPNFNFFIKCNMKYGKSKAKDTCEKQQEMMELNLCLLHLKGLRNSGMAGPTLRGLGQRGWL